MSRFGGVQGPGTRVDDIGVKTPSRRLVRPLVALATAAGLSISGGWALSAPLPETTELASFEVVGAPEADRPLAGVTRAPLERAQTEPEAKPERHVRASIEHDMPITARPGGGRTVGTMPAGSRFYGTQHRAWILEKSADGRFGRVAVPYSARRATGWIRLAGLELHETPYSVEVDLSRHQIVVKRLDDVVMRMPAATGAPASPTPPGRYFVTDRAPFEAGGYLGSFAFGLSGIQPNLPAGWTGGDQLAIHGTNDPGSIGQSVSAGCLRVSEGSLARLKPALKLGTPVIVEA